MPINIRRKLKSTAFALIAAGLVVSADAQAAPDVNKFWDRVKVEGYLMQGFQAVRAQKNSFNAQDQDAESEFNRLRFALGFNINISEKVKAFVELSEEPDDFGHCCQPAIDLALINITLSDSLTLQTGTIVTGLFNFRGYSDGAVVQGNPLIGNSPADMVTAAEGIKLIGKHGMLNWNVAASTSNFGESNTADRGYSYLGQLALNFSNNFKWGFGAVVSSHGDQVAQGVAYASLIRAGLYGGDGDNYRFPSSTTTGIRNTHAGLIPGLDAHAYHTDVQINAGNFTFNGWGGIAEDDFAFTVAGPTRTVASQATGVAKIGSKMTFAGIEGTQYLVPKKLYGAVRYVLVKNDSPGVTGNDKLSRTQVGTGYWFSDVSLLKVEYVKQNEQASSAGQIGDDWGGVVLEASYRF